MEAERARFEACDRAFEDDFERDSRDPSSKEMLEMFRAGWAAASERASQPVAAVGQTDDAQPVAWVRFRSDGGYEGPIMDAQLEEVRKRSGAWTPLFAPSLVGQRDAGGGAGAGAGAGAGDVHLTPASNQTVPGGAA